MNISSRPFFTVITVFFNDPLKIVRTLESLYAQTCQDYEHIIKDACSDEKNILLIKRHICNHRSIFISCPDQGIYEGMNQALKISKGDFVFFLNAGDSFLNEHVLEHTKEYIKKTENNHFYFGDVLFSPELKSSAYPEKIIKSYVFKKNICHQSMFASREALSKVNGFRDRMLLDETFPSILSDQETMWKLIFKMKYNPVKLPLKIAKFERGGFSTSSHIFIRSWLERAALLISTFGLGNFLLYGLPTFITAPFKKFTLVMLAELNKKLS